MSANTQLAEMFARLAAVAQIKGENAFKAIAFQRVSRLLEELSFDAAEAARSGEFPHVEGIGESSRKIIEQFAKTGKSDEYEKAVAAVPAGVLEMLHIPGMGPKTIALLWKERGIESVADLEKAIGEGRLAGVRGLGEKKIQSMLDGIRLLKAGIERRGYLEVTGIVEAITARLAGDARVGAVQVAGSYRRKRETVGDLDFVAWLKKDDDAEAVMELFCTFPGVEKILVSGATKSSILVDRGLQVDLRIVPKSSFGAALLYFTGSKDHNVKLRGIANDRGLTLNEWGIYKISEYEKATKKSGEAPAAKSLSGATEESVYKVLDLPYIVPELREDRGEIEAAEQGRWPKLIERSDIRGELHCHTTASDGNASIEQMVEAAKALGYEFIAITDHSQSSTIANGLAPQRMREHIKEIHRVRDKVKGIHVLAGAEVDILVDGRMDYDQGLLAELDLVIGSPHASLKQDATKATDRIIRAIETKYVNIIGHPTGRMINQRDGLPLDMAKVIEAAARTGTALEINAGWPRWDLNDLNAHAAWRSGVMLSINTDAHSTEGLRTIEMGIWVARRAWVEPKHVVNCLSFSQLRTFLNRKR